MANNSEQPKGVSISKASQNKAKQFGYSLIGLDLDNSEDRKKFDAALVSYVSRVEGYKETSYDDGAGWQTVGTGYNMESFRKRDKDGNIDHTEDRKKWNAILGTNAPDYDKVLSGEISITKTQSDVLLNHELKTSEQHVENTYGSMLQKTPKDLQAAVTLHLIGLQHNAPSTIKSGSDIYKALEAYSENNSHTNYHKFTATVGDEYHNAPANVRNGISIRRSGEELALVAAGEKNMRMQLSAERMKDLAGDLFSAEEIGETSKAILIKPNKDPENAQFIIYQEGRKDIFNQINSQPVDAGIGRDDVARQILLDAAAHKKPHPDYTETQWMAVENTDEFKKMLASSKEYLREKHGAEITHDGPLTKGGYANLRKATDHDADLFRAKATKLAESTYAPAEMIEHVIEFAHRQATKEVAAEDKQIVPTLPSFADLVMKESNLAWAGTGQHDAETAEMKAAKAQLLKEAAAKGVDAEVVLGAIREAELAGFKLGKARFDLAESAAKPAQGAISSFFDTMMEGFKGSSSAPAKAEPTATPQPQDAPAKTTQQNTNPATESPNEFGDKLYKETAAYGFKPSDTLPPKPKENNGLAFNR